MTRKIFTTIFIFTAIAGILFGYFMATALAYSDYLINSADTIAVYQFDNSINDELGDWNLTLNLGSETYSTGTFNQAFSFNGSTNLGSAGELDNNTTWTIGLWASTTLDHSIIYTNVSGDDTAKIQIMIGENDYQSGRPECQLINGAEQTYASGPDSIADGTEHQIICSYDGTYIRLYLDGTQIATTSRSGFVTLDPSALIGSNSDNTQKYTGTLDNFFVTDYRITNDTITEIWNSGNAKRVTTQIPTPSGVDDDQISFNTPINAGTVDDGIFNFWNVNWYGGATTSPNSWYTIEIKYGTSSGGFASATLPWTNSRTWSLSEWNTSNGNAFGGFSLDKTTPLTTGFRYYAQANLKWESAIAPNYNVVSTTTASSTVLFFINTTSTFGTSTDEGCAWWESGFGTCWLQMVFKPHDISLNSFRNTYELMKNTSPFSAIFGTASTIESSAENASSSETNYDLKINYPAPWGTLTLLTSTTLAQFIGTSTAMTVETVFNVQRAVIWVGTGFTILSMFIL